MKTKTQQRVLHKWNRDGTEDRLGVGWMRVEEWVLKGRYWGRGAWCLSSFDNEVLWAWRLRLGAFLLFACPTLRTAAIIDATVAATAGTNASAPPTATTKRTRAALPPPDGPQFGLHFIKVPIGMEPPNAQYKIPNTQYPIPQSRAQSASRVCVSVFHLRPSSSASSKHFAWIAFVRCYAIEVTYRHVNWQPSAEMTLLQFGRRAVIRGSTCRQVLEKSRKNFAMLKNYGFNLYLIWFNLQASLTSNLFLKKLNFKFSLTILVACIYHLRSQAYPNFCQQENFNLEISYSFSVCLWSRRHHYSIQGFVQIPLHNGKGKCWCCMAFLLVYCWLFSRHWVNANFLCIVLNCWPNDLPPGRSMYSQSTWWPQQFQSCN